MSSCQLKMCNAFYFNVYPICNSSWSKKDPSWRFIFIQMIRRGVLRPCEVSRRAKRQHRCEVRIMVYRGPFKSTQIVVASGNGRRERLRIGNRNQTGRKLRWMSEVIILFFTQICGILAWGKELIKVIRIELCKGVAMVVSIQWKIFHTTSASRFQLVPIEGESQAVLESWWGRLNAQLRGVTASAECKAKSHAWHDETGNACHRHTESWTWMPIILGKYKRCKMTTRVVSTWYLKGWSRRRTDSACRAWNGDLVKTTHQKKRRNISTKRRRITVSTSTICTSIRKS